MTWKRIPSLWDAPQEGLKKFKSEAFDLIENAEATFLIQRMDGTNVMVFGTYLQNVVTGLRFIWFVPYDTMHPGDWLGMKALFTKLREHTPHLRAIVDKTNPAAIRVVKHAGARSLGDWAENEELFEWA